jgi:AraC-like DNA-binding protein
MKRVRRTTASTDPDQAADLVAEAYFPHKMRLLGSAEGFGMRLQAANLGPVTVGMLAWGSEVAIDCGYPGVLEVNIPLEGRLVSIHDGLQVSSAAGLGTVFAPDRHTPITSWGADCVVLGVKLDWQHLLAEYRRQHHTELLLPDQLNFNEPRWNGLLNLLRMLPAQFAHDEDLLAGPVATDLLSATITGTLAAGLGATQPMSPGRLLPRTVKRVRDAIEADPARNWTLGDFSELSGVGARRLQQAFREAEGSSPMEYLRHVRLDRSHQDLLEGNGSVRDIAVRWGFLHAGRFSQLYRIRHGRLPSEVLRTSTKDGY